MNQIIIHSKNENQHLLRYQKLINRFHQLSTLIGLLLCRIFSIFLLRNDQNDAEPVKKPEEKKTKSLFDPLPISHKSFPRARYRNFSHVSEFGSGLDMPTKSSKKKDKITEFLDKKRERNTTKRLFGRKTKFE